MTPREIAARWPAPEPEAPAPVCTGCEDDSPGIALVDGLCRRCLRDRLAAECEAEGELQREYRAIDRAEVA